MTKAELLKKSRNQIEVLKDLLLEEKESRNKLELNYKYLSDAVNSEIRKNGELKADNVAYVNDFDKLIKDNDTLKAENKDLIANFKENKAKIKSLKAELSCKDDCIMDLKADAKHDADVCYDVDDEHIKIIDDLKYELKHKAIKVHQDRIPKEYKAEADEYFSHNPKSKGIRFHMIDFDEYGYDENEGLNGLMGTFSGELYADDCIVEIDNS